MDAKSSIKEIRQKTRDYLEDKKKCNNIVDVISGTLSDHEVVIVTSIQCLNKIFCHILHSKDLYIESDWEKDTVSKYKSWLCDQYSEAKQRLREFLNHSSYRIQELSLRSLMKWIELESVHPTSPCEKPYRFPEDALNEIIAALLSDSQDLNQIIGKFTEYLEFSDVHFYTLKCLAQLIKSSKEKEKSEKFSINFFYLLSKIKISGNSGSSKTLSEDGIDHFKSSPGQEQQRFSNIWISFLQLKLPSKLYKQILIIMPDDIMPYLKNPLLLSDFLIESYDKGGATSLLALNSLFILVHKYHLDYPNFYEKLYTLFEPSIFYQKYRARFFFLSDLFLSSSHLPAYMVASFAKKLARLSLTSPAYSLLYVTPFIGNLLIRHPSLSILINKPSPSDISEDPFIMEEIDPSKTNAMESSLWELKTLQNHWYPDASKKAKFVNGSLPKMEWNISDSLETTYQDLFQKIKDQNFRDAPTNFYKPSGLFDQKEDKMKDLWSLE